MLQKQSDCFYATHFVEAIFKMKLNTIVTKYTNTLTFYFAPTMTPMWGIMSLYRTNERKVSYHCKVEWIPHIKENYLQIEN